MYFGRQFWSNLVFCPEDGGSSLLRALTGFAVHHQLQSRRDSCESLDDVCERDSIVVDQPGILSFPTITMSDELTISVNFGN
jgi:hypothetical protein